jgi:hypothetical protein
VRRGDGWRRGHGETKEGKGRGEEGERTRGMGRAREGSEEGHGMQREVGRRGITGIRIKKSAQLYKLWESPVFYSLPKIFGL